MATNNSCLLCGNIPDEGMHITGKKVIKGDLMDYQLCKNCCLSKDEINDIGMPSRKKVQEKVEVKLLSLIKGKKRRVK